MFRWHHGRSSGDDSLAAGHCRRDGEEDVDEVDAEDCQWTPDEVFRSGFDSRAILEYASRDERRDSSQNESPQKMRFMKTRTCSKGGNEKDGSLLFSGSDTAAESSATRSPLFFLFPFIVGCPLAVLRVDLVHVFFSVP